MVPWRGGQVDDYGSWKIGVVGMIGVGIEPAMFLFLLDESAESGVE